MTITVPCPTCCGGGGGGGPGGCPPGANCRVGGGTNGGPDPLGCVTNANFDLTFVSLTGSGCLVGYEEFVFGTPSDPPVKYLNKTFTGFTRIEGTCGGIGCAGCNSDYSQATYSGSNNWSPTTGLLTQSSNGTVETNGSGCGPGIITFTGVIENLTDAGVNGGTDGQTCQTIVSKVQMTATVLDQFCNPGTSGCYNTHSACGGYYTFRSGNATETLSNPDTYQDALTRSGAVTGTDYTAVLSVFVGYCFTGNTSNWTANFTGLNALCGYRFTVTYSRDTVVDPIVEVIEFSPGGDTYVLTGEVPAVPLLVTRFSGALLEFIS